MLSNLSSVCTCNWSHLGMMQLLLILVMIRQLLNKISNCPILHANWCCSIILYSILIQHTFCFPMILLLRILLWILIASLSCLDLILFWWWKKICLIWIWIFFISLRFIFVHFSHIYNLNFVFWFLRTH